MPYHIPIAYLLITYPRNYRFWSIKPSFTFRSRLHPKKKASPKIAMGSKNLSPNGLIFWEIPNSAGDGGENCFRQVATRCWRVDPQCMPGGMWQSRLPTATGSALIPCQTWAPGQAGGIPLVRKKKRPNPCIE